MLTTAGTVDGQERTWLQNPSFSREQAQEVQRLFTADRTPTPQETPRGSEGQERELLSSSSDSGDHRSPRQRGDGVEHKKKGKKRHRKHEDKHRRKRHKQSVEGNTALESAKPRTIWLDEAGLDLKDAYRLDSKPDTNNLRYAGLYSGDVTSYRRRFGSHCLGLGSHQAIEWTDGRSKSFKKDGKKEKPTRYFRGGKTGSSVRSQSDVVLQFPGKRASSEVPQVEEYLVLEGEGEAGEEQAEQAAIVTPEVYISRRTAKYNRSLLEDPYDIRLWLEFIAFQDEALVWGRLPAAGMEGEESSVSYSKRRGQLVLFERKVAIYERALESNPLSVELLVGHMDLVQEVWETENLVRRWKDLVFQQPNKSRLWLNYIEFCQSRFSSFTTSSLTALYKKAVSTLSSIQDGRLKSHRPDPDTPNSLLAVFALYCSFLRQTGHSERGVACFQALIEFNLCCPGELLSTEVTFKEKAEFFEAFWDSGVPRFGEEGAAGWNSWLEATKKSGAATHAQLGALDASVFRKAIEAGSDGGTDDEIDPEVSKIAGLSLREAWLVLEQDREREGGLPWRPDTAKGESEDDCTDPDRMVVFDDVSATLFSVTDPKLHLRLVLSFLHFLGAPLPAPPTDSPLPHLPFTGLESPSEVYTAPSALIRSLLSATPLVCLPTAYQLMGTGRGCNLFRDSRLDQLVSNLSFLPEQDPTASDFISNVCNQALTLLGDGSEQIAVAQVWIHHELSLVARDLVACCPSKPGKAVRSKVKTVQKLVKGLLRLESHRNNLSLWNSCALLENQVGNFSESVRLYESVLSQYKSGPECSQGLLELYVCFCSCLLGLEPSLVTAPRTKRDSKLALHALVCLAEGRTYEVVGAGEPVIPPGRLLKARAVFEKIASLNEQESRAQWTICCACFEYLTKGLKCACEVLDRYTRTSTADISLEEAASTKGKLYAVLHFQCRLVLHHSLGNPIQPAVLRRALQKSLNLFPDDGWFLVAYINSEQQSYISGGLRRYFDSQAPRASTPLPWLFAVWAELQRRHRLRDLREAGGGGAFDEPETGTVHRTGALLRRAVESSTGRHCPLLWRLLMKFEVGGTRKNEASMDHLPL